MRLLGTYLFPVLWTAFFCCWQVMSVNVKATRRLEPATSRISRAVLSLSAVVLLADSRIPIEWLHWNVLIAGNLTFLVGAAITLAGLLFAVWARRHLGQNWSRAVTIKEDHELIVTGPYAVVRHPIYTGLLTGFLGSAIAIAELRGFLALSMIFIALLTKLRLEERWMRDQFGASYESYSRQVAALVPFVL